MNRIFDARRAGCAIASFAHRVALPSWPASDEFSCKHEIRPSRPGRLRNSLPRHSQKRIFDARRAGCAIASFAHREALPSCPAMGEFSCKHEIRLQARSGRLRNSLPRHSQNASSMLAALAAPSLLLLIERRFLRVLRQTNFHASMKFARRRIRVNCVKMY